MSEQFDGFKANRPIVNFSDKAKTKLQVFFNYWDESGKKYYFRYSKGFNKGRMADRRAMANDAAYELWQGLLNGWNPLKDDYPIFSEVENRLLQLTFGTGLDYAFNKKKTLLSRFSIPNYKTCLGRIKLAAKECGCIDTAISAIERKDIRAVIATAKETHGWTSDNRNKNLKMLQSFFTVLVDEDKIKFNPAHGIKGEPVDQTEGFKRLSDQEKESIATHLMNKHPYFFDYLMFIYQLGIRRKELCMIRIGDISLDRRLITIRPEVAKTNSVRHIPITDDILEILLSREIHKLPADWILFSNDQYKPGPVAYHPNTPTRLWDKLVQKQLGINCKMYSLKHKGADDKIEAGIPLDVLRTLYGHKSKQMTEIYAKAVKEKYRQQLINNSPSFAKVIPMKKVR